MRPFLSTLMRFPTCILIVAASAACASPESGADDTSAVAADTSAMSGGGRVVMRSAAGDEHGTLRVVAANGGLRVQGTLRALPPGRHGIHIHMAGQCDAPAFESAGGHFNPGGRQHGLENPAGPHAGDAPNIEVDRGGQAVIDLTFAQATADANASSGIWDGDGSAMVLHADADDQRTDPSGNSGARIACGVIERD